jgi:D-amino peptidase
MKLFVSADIEGVAGMIHWDEADPSKSDYRWFQERMNEEVLAACEGALAAGCTEVLVKDAHAGGRNLVPSRFPETVSIHRGWSGHPLAMMEGVDGGFDAAVFIGYHARGGSLGNPLAHTMSSSKFTEMRLNGEPLSEFRINALSAARAGVPVVAVSGDEALCDEIRAWNPAIELVVSKTGLGASAYCRHPETVRREIRDAVERGLRDNPQRCLKALPPSFRFEMEFKDPSLAFRKSFYPGARLERERIVVIETKDWFDVIRAMGFMG